MHEREYTPMASAIPRDILDLFEEGEKTVARRLDGDVLIAVTTNARKIAIGPGGWFAVLTGPPFPYVPAEPDPAPAAAPAGDVNA